MIIAMDGPSGSGKSTLARAVARELGFEFLDTGAMYRTIALAAVRRDIPLNECTPLSELARTLAFEVTGDPDGTKVVLEGEDVSQAIRTAEMDEAASTVAKCPGVRDAMIERQRSWAEGRDLVCEGRDMQTVVFPDAEVKIFLKADLEMRAKRRHAERSGGKTLDEVRAELQRRDKSDVTRAVGPLKAHPDAVHLDTTDLTVEQAAEKTSQIVRNSRQALN